MEISFLLFLQIRGAPGLDVVERIIQDYEPARFGNYDLNEAKMVNFLRDLKGIDFDGIPDPRVP